MRQLAIVFFKLSTAIQENFSEEALDDALSVVNEASKKFEEITKKLKSEKA